ncbi:virulence effector protein [Salmonella enterica subsp. enterica]|uniref:Virulence effector protein n=1 Tax=Salmonella enterica I TaxID=59201 RepID=A0A447MSN7_SALET|nr:virulence effector protein [Salmonella enterica subsp. enterica]
MTKPLNATQAVIEWVNNTRRYATRLDDEADALLAQLTLAARMSQRSTPPAHHMAALVCTGMRNPQKRIC